MLMTAIRAKRGLHKALLRLIEPHVLLKLEIIGHSFIIWGLDCLATESLLYKMVRQGDATTLLVAWCLLPLSMFVLLDVVVNDLMNDNYVNAMGMKWRHLAYMALGLCYGIEMWSISVVHYYPWSLAYYGVCLVLLPLVALQDVLSSKPCPPCELQNRRRTDRA
jgi:hypothetical protein